MTNVNANACGDGSMASLQVQLCCNKIWNQAAEPDKGFVFASDTYTGESARRKIIGEENGRKVLADIHDSTADFEIVAQPTPRAF